MRQTYLRYGFGLSALIHLGLWGGVAWLLLSESAPGLQEQAHRVPVTLAMFAPPPEPVQPQPLAERSPPPKAIQPLPPLEAPSPEPTPVQPEPIKPRPQPVLKKSGPKRRPVKKISQIPQAKVAAAIPAPALQSDIQKAVEMPIRDNRADLKEKREVAKATYLARLRAAIARYKFYPRLSRRRGEEGRVLVELLIDVDGGFREMRVDQSSGNRRLDDAALKTLQRLGHADPLPSELGEKSWRISVPMVFSLRH